MHHFVLSSSPEPIRFSSFIHVTVPPKRGPLFPTKNNQKDKKSYALQQGPLARFDYTAVLSHYLPLKFTSSGSIIRLRHTASENRPTVLGDPTPRKMNLSRQPGLFIDTRIVCPATTVTDVWTYLLRWR